MSQRKRKVDWEFSFDRIGDRIGEMFDESVDFSEIETYYFGEPLGEATSARIKLGFALGTANVVPLPDPDHLIEASVTTFGPVSFEVSGEQEKSVRLEQRTGRRFGFSSLRHFGGLEEQLRWDIALTPQIPLNLEVAGGLGRANLDLSGLQLAGLKVGAGVGKITITLPVTETEYEVKVEAGVGKTHITVPEGAAVRLKVRGGVGATRISLPGNPPLHVKASSGLGGIHLPDHVIRVGGKDSLMNRNGVWETADFQEAARPVVIDYQGGVGALKIDSGPVMV